MAILRKRFGFWLFLLSGGLCVHGFDPESDGIDGIKEVVRKRFPEVRQLPSDELATWLNDTNRVQPLLLDVRKPEEFAISHLRDAVNVDPDAKAAEVESVLESKAATGRPVVVYCSVGYRSSALARRLMKHGVTNVFNLEGSIFQWANEDRPLVCGPDKAPAESVHPYNRRWRVLLKPERRAPAD